MSIFAKNHALSAEPSIFTGCHSEIKRSEIELMAELLHRVSRIYRFFFTRNCAGDIILIVDTLNIIQSYSLGGI